MSSNATLLPHAPVTPLSTVATSVVPEGALAIIEWCVFDDIPQKQVVKLYNDVGYGNIQSHHGVSKQLMRYATRWYEEQGGESFPGRERRKREQKIRGLTELFSCESLEVQDGCGEEGRGEEGVGKERFSVRASKGFAWGWCGRRSGAGSGSKPGGIAATATSPAAAVNASSPGFEEWTHTGTW
jgi:hypothetical protein